MASVVRKSPRKVVAAQRQQVRSLVAFLVLDQLANSKIELPPTVHLYGK